MSLTFRIAEKDEYPEINLYYEQIHFAPSSVETDQVVLAEENGIKAGLGRCVRFNEHQAELGGIYVFEPFRGKQIAQKIVLFLLAHNTGYKEMFCIPFSHLKDLYSRFGFEEYPYSQAPPEIRKKLNWCSQTQSQNVLLLCRRS